MYKSFLVLLSFVLLVGMPSFSAEAPCGIDREAGALISLAKSELGVYSAVVTPFVSQILEQGGMEVASADAKFDQLAIQAKNDGYKLDNIVAGLKKFNRLVVNCKEYPEHMNRKKEEKEFAAKQSEFKRQAKLAAMQKQREEERLAAIEKEKEEQEKAIQEQIKLENERKKQEEERQEQIKLEYQNRLDLKLASLSKGCIIKIPNELSTASQADSSFRGMTGLFSGLSILNDQYIITLKEMKDLDLQQITADTLFKAIKKRKKYNIALSSDDFLNLEIVARNEKEFFNN